MTSVWGGEMGAMRQPPIVQNRPASRVIASLFHPVNKAAGGQAHFIPITGLSFLKSLLDSAFPLVLEDDRNFDFSSILHKIQAFLYDLMGEKETPSEDKCPAIIPALWWTVRMMASQRELWVHLSLLGSLNPLRQLLCHHNAMFNNRGVCPEENENQSARWNGKLRVKITETFLLYSKTKSIFKWLQKKSLLPSSSHTSSEIIYTLVSARGLWHIAPL